MKTLNLLPLMTVLLIVTVDGVKQNWKKRDKDQDFDFFTLAIIWPPTTCMAHPEKVSQIDVNNRELTCPERWSIHGLWPSKTITSGPVNCKGEEFDQNALTAAKHYNPQSWIDLKQVPMFLTHNLFSYQWNKHGKCVLALSQVITSQEAYFDTAFSKFAELSVDKTWLSNADKYLQVDSLNDHLKQKWGARPVIKCWNKGGKAHLEEILICYDKQTLNKIDCPVKEFKGCTGNTIIKPYRGV